MFTKTAWLAENTEVVLAFWSYSSQCRTQTCVVARSQRAPAVLSVTTTLRSMEMTVSCRVERAEVFSIRVSRMDSLEPKSGLRPLSSHLRTQGKRYPTALQNGLETESLTHALPSCFLAI